MYHASCTVYYPDVLQIVFFIEL